MPIAGLGLARNLLFLAGSGIDADYLTNTTIRLPTLNMYHEERKVHTQSANTCSRRHFLRLAAGGVGAALVGRQGIASAASGKISVYSALNESTNNAFVEAFKKSVPGINVELLPLAAAGELQTRIRTEKDSPKGDVFIGGSSEFHSPLGTE